MLDEKKNEAVELTDDDLDQVVGGVNSVFWKKRGNDITDDGEITTIDQGGVSQSNRFQTNRYRK